MNYVSRLRCSRPFASGHGLASRLIAGAALGLAFGGGVLVAQAGNGRAAKASANAAANWGTSWGSAQLAPYGTEVLPAGALDGATLRQVVHLSAGGTRIRLRLSNAFGQQPLELTAVHVALRSSDKAAGAIDPATDRPVTFAGATAVSVPMGADFLSDPIAMRLPAQADLVVTMEIGKAPSTPTFHAGAHATSFLVSGDHASEARLGSPKTFTRWYFLSGVEVQGNTAGSVVAFGDSITDGHAATTDGNDRWPDVLSARMAANAKTRGMGVVNEGIGGNRMLADGLGPNALARFDRDVLSVAGARTLIVLEGINDLGGLDRTEAHPQADHDALVTRLEATFLQVVARAHEHSLRVLGGTLTPFAGSDYYHPSPASETDRTRLNEWIRTSGTFDGVIDFDRALRDPAHPERMAAQYDSGDHLHPGPAGYRRMGELISLSDLQ